MTTTRKDDNRKLTPLVSPVQYNMGHRSDIAELLIQSKWSEEGSYLGEILKNPGFPMLVKVVRGQYQNIGTASFSNPNLISHLLLISAGKIPTIAAQCVKFKNNPKQRVVPFGPTLMIPELFQGHFEILSEDGKCVPCLQTVEQLIHKFPDSCLIREPIKAYKSAPIEVSSKSGITELLLIGDDSGRISEKTKVLLPGDVIVLIGEVNVPSGRNKTTKYLKCFDPKGQTIYLNSSQKGKFSPIGRQESISGVHTTRNILSKRMPMMVRMVDGKPPLIPLTSKNCSSFKFVPELRLFTTIQEELVFGMPLSQNSKDIMSTSTPSILALPLSVPLKFQICRNMTQIEGMKEFSRLHERLKLLGDTAKNLIQIHDTNLKKELRFDGRQWKSYTPPIPFPLSILSTENSNDRLSQSSPSSHNYDEIPDVTDYEDIDEIYDYVRGIKPTPPPPKAKTNGISSVPSHQGKRNTTVKVIEEPIISITPGSKVTASIIIGSQRKRSLNISRVPIRNEKSLDIFAEEPIEKPPEPPPIETIPTHKNKINNSKFSQNVTMLISSGGSPSNTVTSSGSGGTTGTTTSGVSSEDPALPRKHLYVKRQATANLESTVFGLSGSPANRLLFRRSPIFDCRYKSMNDLHRSSLGSNGSVSSGKKQLTYFNRHNNFNSAFDQNTKPNAIFRPKSLTNLLEETKFHILLPHAAIGSKKKLLENLGSSQPKQSSMDLLQKFCHNSQSHGQIRGKRKFSQPTLYL